ncbi:unnamed protein product [Eruca vesicaria subsp. sativa]|uniref:Protein kinase domain-containing protein n=1 Tax=Eruca vesicaria subsp. sativa TaxID=29727 RepID=A0ABC8IW71_ERUVS|nr:unnamed protein product [Eruca vesicaria subsp. sativa]
MPSRPISSPSPASPPPSSRHDKTPPLTAAAAGGCFSLFITLSVCFCKLTRKRPPPPPAGATASSSPPPPREFSYSTLRRATASFSPTNRLGQGGFGAVFRGTLSSGENVAVKVMDSGSLQGEAEFQNELFFAGKLLDSSPHVVPVIGFSHDKKRRRLLLVYELMDNGNLQDALLHRKCPELMEWSKRFLVAVNVAEGIEHLHGLERPVIHGDVKPSNVLLDKDFNAKIADFGLARVKPEHVEMITLDGGGGGGGGPEEELESVITTATGYEDFNFGPVVGSSPEMRAAPLESPETVVSVSPEKGKESERRDWWWKQESNVERGKVKEYVMQWIGSEVKKERPSSVDWMTTASSSESSKKKSSKRLEWWLSLEEESENKKKKKRRMVREWWKDEYRREVSKKKKKKKTLESEFCSDDGRRSNSKGSSIDWWLDGLRARGNSHDSVSVSGEMAKSCGISSTPSMRGTVCYAAPEYCNVDNNNVSEKCDVYSYGVLLLVLVSGRRPLEMTGSASEIQRANLMSWARKLARKEKLVDLVDQKLQNLDQEQAVLCIKVALQCLQRLPVSRPSMKEVIGMLKGEVSVP